MEETLRSYIIYKCTFGVLINGKYVCAFKVCQITEYQ